MSKTKIEKLTPEQEALIPIYRDKWRRIALSTEPIDRQKATETIKATHALIGLLEPRQILFFDSPYAALDSPAGKLESQLKKQQWWHQQDQLLDRLFPLRNKLYGRLVNQLRSQIENTLWERLWRQIAAPFLTYDRYLYIDRRAESLSLSYGIWFDFCISVLDLAYDQATWEVYQALLKDCGWVFWFNFDKICLICDRPIKLSFDTEYCLHAEGEPAIHFADGYSLYSYHGVTLPKKYGKVHPRQWQAQWLLEEENAELRRILIQEIGYDRICKELQASELDSWQEYSLLKLNSTVDIEPVYLLKMICPSTGFIHAIRVPPDMKSAREAICWVNWGIAPEEFLQQS